jgi:hypothetical protein
MSRLTVEEFKHQKNDYIEHVYCPFSIVDLIDTIEAQQQEIQKLDYLIRKEETDHSETLHKLLKAEQEIEQLKIQMVQAVRGNSGIIDLAVENVKLQQEIEQHIKWNEAHTKARVELSEENKQLRDMLKRSIETATFFKNHYTGTVGEYLDYSNLITDANKLLKGDGEV